MSTMNVFDALNARARLINRGPNVSGVQGSLGGEFSNLGVIDPYLDQGWSYEDIAPRVGKRVDTVRAYADSTRPGYGVSYDGVVQGGKVQGDKIGGAFSSGSGGSSRPAYDPNDLAYLDAQRDLYQRLLGDVDTFQRQGLESLSDSYTTERNKANKARGRALEDFQTQREDTTRDKQRALGEVNTNARTLADSLRRILGLASGRGSSAYRFAAPEAVARTASQNRSNVLGRFGENERNLVTAENRAKSDFEELLEDLARQRSSNEERLRTGFDTQRQGIQNTLAEIAGERARLIGGNPLSATAPYRTAYLGLQDQITGYPDQFRTAVTPRSVSVNPVSLRDYLVDRQAINANQAQGEDEYSPYRQFLRRRVEEER